MVIGSGGREHALAWKLRNSPSVREVLVVPGNPGAEQVAECVPGTDYLQLAERHAVNLTVVGPEAPLVAGIVDRFRARNMPIVGPTAENAALEGSKVLSKRLMRDLGIPTARFSTAHTYAEAAEALNKYPFPVVVKTDGLAAGKGVAIASTPAEAELALRSLAYPLVIEEFLAGEEISFIALCDGSRALPLEPSRDHKRAFDGDNGPNTGGMGAYSESALLTPDERSSILETIVHPIVRANGFTGFLYAGLMMTPAGPRVLEFNVRMGDPETQPLMMRLESDLGEILMAAARGELDRNAARWSSDTATCVVLASGGYPGNYAVGQAIAGLDRTGDAVIFHAGTRRKGNRTVTAGGRVLGVTARGIDLRQSRDRAYGAVAAIHFEGMHYRKDIGEKGL